jgi:hypothetical protein
MNRPSGRRPILAIPGTGGSTRRVPSNMAAWVGVQTEQFPPGVTANQLRSCLCFLTITSVATKFSSHRPKPCYSVLGKTQAEKQDQENHREHKKTRILLGFTRHVRSSQKSEMTQPHPHASLRTQGPSRSRVLTDPILQPHRPRPLVRHGRKPLTEGFLVDC